MDKELRNLVKLLRRKATIESKKIKNDVSHYEGMCKGLYLGYEDAASRLDKILREREKKSDTTCPDKDW